jgi:hypothetical protein
MKADVCEKFTVEITEAGELVVQDSEQSLRFSPAETLMLLDILQQEEEFIRRKSQAACPLPLSFKESPNQKRDP